MQHDEPHQMKMCVLCVMCWELALKINLPSVKVVNFFTSYVDRCVVYLPHMCGRKFYEIRIQTACLLITVLGYLCPALMSVWNVRR